MRFADRELDIMSVLWERGSGTVAEVRQALPDDLAYTSVLTMLQVLERKGAVRRELEGKAHRYFPIVLRTKARGQALSRMVERFFAGSRTALMAQLISDRKLKAKDLRELRDLLDERLKEKDT
jgi:predicted transcriptional regulator